MINTRARRSARERAVQFLFGQEFTQYAWEDAIEEFWTLCPSRPSVKSYAETLIRGVCAHRKELDRQIAEALDKWSPDRVGYLEWAVVRVALYEMIHVSDVPAAVAMNEAIEVTKRFGADDAPRFVNGVLDRLFHSVTENR
ncbi:MAG TPA: transcription antitermination factor NusB [Candidatus Hydrogenedentes bacterium]|nr:transcription antitermination factor NusB [Candidatus Hydrogenedentota bacterium]